MSYDEIVSILSKTPQWEELTVEQQQDAVIYARMSLDTIRIGHKLIPDKCTDVALRIAA